LACSNSAATSQSTLRIRYVQKCSLEKNERRELIDDF